MQTALHILTVVAESRREIIPAELYSTEFYRKQRTARLFFRKEKKKFALSLSFHPLTHGLLFTPAGKLHSETNEKPFPFFQELYGYTLTEITQISFDRIVKLDFHKDQRKSSVVIEALGPSGNIWRLDESEGKQAVLRNREFEPGEKYTIPGGGERVSPVAISPDNLKMTLSAQSELPISDALRKRFSGFDSALARELVTRAQIEINKTVSALAPEDFVALADSIARLLSLAGSPESGYLYSMISPPCAQPFKLKSVAQIPDKFPSYSLAALALGSLKKTSGDTADEGKRIKRALKRAIDHQRRVISNVSNDEKEYQRHQRHKQIADILTANIPSIKRGMGEVTLPNLFGAGDVTIELDAKLSGAENADAYYRKYQKGREGLEKARRRLEIANGELARLENIQRAFDENPDETEERYTTEIAELLSGSMQSGAPSADPVKRLPYRTYTISTGLKVFVGRDGSDNDDTTFKHIKPYELWFHASQCPGSHVGLKFPNKDFKPSKQEIEETAAIAAWFSKARNNSSAPVNYTERRYVRKPRKSKSGLVTIEREKSIMVSPQEPEKNSGQ